MLWNIQRESWDQGRGDTIPSVPYNVICMSSLFLSMLLGYYEYGLLTSRQHHYCQNNVRYDVVTTNHYVNEL